MIQQPSHSLFLMIATAALTACWSKPPSIDIDQPPTREMTDMATFQFDEDPSLGEITYQARALVSQEDESKFTMEVRIEQKNSRCRGASISMALLSDYIEAVPKKKFLHPSETVTELKLPNNSRNDQTRVYRRIINGGEWYIFAPTSWSSQCLLQKASQILKKHPGAPIIPRDNPDAIWTSHVEDAAHLGNPLRRHGSETRFIISVTDNWWAPVIERKSGELVAIAFLRRTGHLFRTHFDSTDIRPNQQSGYETRDWIGFTETDRSLTAWQAFVNCVFDPSVHLRKLGPRQWRMIPEEPEKRLKLLSDAESYWFYDANDSPYFTELNHCSYIKARQND